MNRRSPIFCAPIRLCWLAAILCLSCADFAQAHPAWGIAVTPEGAVYFADTERHRIWMITPNGRLRMLLAAQNSHALVLASNGYLYGENSRYDDVGKRWLAGFWRARSEKTYEEILPLTANVPPGSGILRDAAGTTYSIEQTPTIARILKRTREGLLTALAGGPRGYADGTGEQARFSFLEAITTGEDGALYVRDNATIRRVALDGAVTTIGGNPLGGMPHSQENGLLGLATDKRGNVYVADMQAHCLRRIRPDNQVETIWESGWLWTPTGVAVQNDVVYVLESLPASSLLLGIGPYLRVQRLEANGAAMKLATVWGPTTRTALGLLILSFALFSLIRLRRADMNRD